MGPDQALAEHNDRNHLAGEQNLRECLPKISIVLNDFKSIRLEYDEGMETSVTFENRV